MKMKTHTDWTDEVRRVLRDAEVRPAEGGWERLQRDLDTMDPPVSGRVTGAHAAEFRRARWRMYGARIAAAAAVVLLGIVTGELLWQSEPEAGNNDVPVLASVTGQDAVELGEDIQSGSGPALDRVRSEVGTERFGQASGGSSLRTRLAEASGWSQSPAEENRTDSETGMMARVTPQGENSERGIVRSEAEPRAAQTGRSEVEPRAAQTGRSEAEPRAAQSSGRRETTLQRSVPTDDPFADPLTGKTSLSGRTSLAFFAGGGMTGNSGMGNTPLRSYSIMASDAVAVIGNGNNFSPMLRRDYDESSFRHHLPLSFGFTVRKEFPYGLSLESGVIYTLLRSDVRLRYSSDDVSQKLHLIGIPLRMNWQFVEQGRFAAYLGAGGMVEKCISAKFGSEAVDEGTLQWSVAGALGVQYLLVDHVGMYFEPEVSYYLTDTSLRTSRSDAPLTLTLRLGVRVLF